MEKCKYKRIDEEHNTYQCEACGHIVNLEADGPYENGMEFCAHCGREIVHPFRCECGYVGEPEKISFAVIKPVPIGPRIENRIGSLIEYPGLVCCPECRTVKFPRIAHERK